jgi:hypothetical protein
MAIQHQYILDAIQEHGLSVMVDVMVGDKQTKVKASIALAELSKPPFKRRPQYKTIAPIVHKIKDAVVAVIDAVFEEKDAEGIEEDESPKRKRKKQTDEIDES